MKRFSFGIAVCALTAAALLVVVPTAFAQQPTTIELRTENSAGQHAASKVTPIELVTEHSAGQNVVLAHAVAAPAGLSAATIARPFSWRDAGIGAAAALVAMLAVAATFVLQRRIRPAATNG